MRIYFAIYLIGLVLTIILNYIFKWFVKEDEHEHGLVGLFCWPFFLIAKIIIFLIDLFSCVLPRKK
jgi:hypothetical protein